MRIRAYQSKDCAALAALFYNTVHTVNARDYTQAQLDVWATGHVDLAAWDRSFLAHNTFVAELDGVIAGFGDRGSTYASKNSPARGFGMCSGLAKCVTRYGTGRTTPGTM